MGSIDALAKAIKEFEGGVVIVSHDFRTLSCSSLSALMHWSHFLGCIGLIGQVAEELWEVADKTIHNLTKQEIDIVGYKRNLIKQSKSKWHIFDICSSDLKKVMLLLRKLSCFQRQHQKERRSLVSGNQTECHGLIWPST